MEDALRSGTTVEDLVSHKRFASRAAVPLDWFLRKLAAEDLISTEGSGRETLFRLRGNLPSGDPAAAEARAQAINARSMPPFRVVRAMVESIPEFLRGEKT